MNEYYVWRNKLRPVLVRARAHVVRLESDTHPGIPDINFCWENQDYWVELKTMKELPKRITTRTTLGLQPVQGLWLQRRTAAGGKCRVMCYLQSTRVWIIMYGHFYDLAQKQFNTKDLMQYGNTLPHKYLAIEEITDDVFATMDRPV